MRILLHITKAQGMVDGWHNAVLECFDTSYSDKDKFKNLKMMWKPTCKQWYMDCNIKATPEQVAQHITSKVRSQWQDAKVETYVE